LNFCDKLENDVWVELKILRLKINELFAEKCLIPSSVVVKYEDPVSINCSTLDPQHKGMGWEAPHGGTTVLQVPALTWALANVTDWNPTPECFINPSPEFGKQCSKVPDIIVYKTIDISSSGSSDGVVREGETYSLTCEIKRVAPLQRLTMRWYKDDTLFHTDTFDSSSRKPVDQSSVINFTSTRQDSGVTFRCEAHLDLSPDGPQLYLTSQEYNVTVYCKYIMLTINTEQTRTQTMNYERAAASETDHNEHLTDKQNHSAAVSDLQFVMSVMDWDCLSQLTIFFY
uniref:Ig-like domain-containing protein n=1 Tax=Sphaeramia orbicularis TaxID=375764 RepID=A0A673BZ35_9TELE